MWLSEHCNTMKPVSLVPKFLSKILSAVLRIGKADPFSQQLAFGHRSAEELRHHVRSNEMIHSIASVNHNRDVYEV